MKFAAALAALLGLALATPAAALVKYDEGGLIIDGVQLLQDANDELSYYYLPQFPRLATKQDGETLEFLCVKYVGQAGKASGGHLPRAGRVHAAAGPGRGDPGQAREAAARRQAARPRAAAAGDRGRQQRPRIVPRRLGDALGHRRGRLHALARDLGARAARAGLEGGRRGDAQPGGRDAALGHAQAPDLGRLGRDHRLLRGRGEGVQRQGLARRWTSSTSTSAASRTARPATRSAEMRRVTDELVRTGGHHDRGRRPLEGPRRRRGRDAGRSSTS